MGNSRLAKYSDPDSHRDPHFARSQNVTSHTKMTRHLLIWTAFLTLTGGTVFGQTNCDTTKYAKLLNNSSQCWWTFFQLTDTITGTILRHEKQMVACGHLAGASLTIVKTEKDTVRVIDLCNGKNYVKGQKIKIIPRTEPTFQVNLPFHVKWVDKGKNKYILISNKFDKVVLKTTWGHITK